MSHVSVGEKIIEMGVVRRIWNKERCDLHKKYKRPIVLVANTMQPGFSDADFYTAFKNLQPILWRELQEKYISYRELDKARKQKGRTLRLFPSPKRFLLSEAENILKKIRNQHTLGNYKEHNLEEKRRVLTSQAARRLKIYNDKLKKDLYYIQEVNPPYVSKLIQIYYRNRRQNSLDVNNRLAIIQEAAKFKSFDTIRFLKKVQSGDKNENLRLAAYFALLQMHAPDVRLHRKRKGKKKMSQILEPEERKTPQELLDLVYSADYEKIKEFDVFISHSSQNEGMIASLVKTLNLENYVCYVDWMADRQQLNRQLTCKETAEVIINRIKQSRVFVYVLTKECIASKWSPWELGYAYAIGKPICIYHAEEVDDKPEYLDLHLNVTDQQEVVKYIKTQKK